MGRGDEGRVRVCAMCRGEGTGYVAFVSKRDVASPRAEVRTSGGAPLPRHLFRVEVPSEREVLAPRDAFAWIVVFPLLDVSCVVTLFGEGVETSDTDGEEPLVRCTFSPRASKVRSRLLSKRAPAVAALLRGFEQRRGAGRPLLFVRDVWPADDGRVAWRMQAEFPTDDARSVPSLVVRDGRGDKVDAHVVVMEDHVVPFVRDDALPARLVTFSCLLPESLGNFYASACLGEDASLEAFACMNAPRAQGMLADVRRFTAGAVANGFYPEWFANTRATEAELARQRDACAALDSDKRPLMSVVVPVLDESVESLKATAASLVAQSWDRWELVLVNSIPVGCVAPSERSVLPDGLGGADETSGHVVVSPDTNVWGKGVLGAEDGVGDSREALRDGRVRVVHAPGESVVGAVNAGLDAAQGDYVAFLGVGDTLEPDALWWYAKQLKKTPEADVLYCDEDVLRDGRVCEPCFKSFPNYGALYTRNSLGRMLMLSRRVLDAIERPDEDVYGAEEYDLVLKAFEVAREVVHVPRVLCHRSGAAERYEAGACGTLSLRAGSSGEAEVYEAGRRALAAHLARRQIEASVDDGPLPGTYRVRYRLPDPLPMVSIVIPTRDHADLLRTCVQSILRLSTYERFELVLVENGSCEEATFALYDELCADVRVRVVRWQPGEEGFNYSALINFGVAHSTGELLVLLNNDTEVIEPAWLEEMAGCLMRPEVGVVGAKLLFYDGLIQHVGMVANPAGDNCHVCQNLTRDALGPGLAAALPGDYSMVTGACQMVRRSLFDELGGYDEDLAVGFNDGDFCLRAGEAGYAVTMAPHALLYHREFSTRGREITDVRLRTRFLKERAYAMQKHAEFYAQADPALNPNLNGFSAYFDL